MAGGCEHVAGQKTRERRRASTRNEEEGGRQRKMKQRDSEEMVGRGAQDRGLAADRTRAHELDRRLSHCFVLARLCSPRRHSPHFFFVSFCFPVYHGPLSGSLDRKPTLWRTSCGLSSSRILQSRHAHRHLGHDHPPLRRPNPNGVHLSPEERRKAVRRA